MRPVRFVALSEDGQAFVLADEVGRLLALPIDDRVHTALHPGDIASGGQASLSIDVRPSLAPRDIQARIRSGESAEDVARVAGVPVDRVLRYAGPVLQERAMLAQHARRTKLRDSAKGATLAEVVDAKLSQHGIDTEKISWDASRRDDGTWRISATWPSGKATAQALWDLDKARQVVTPHDEMAQYLCADRASQVVQDDGALRPPTRGETSRGDLSRGGHEPMRPGGGDTRQRSGRGLTNDPIRAGRDALLASLDRPLGTPTRGPARQEPIAPAASAIPPIESESRARGAAALIGRSPFDDDSDVVREVPAVPSLAVLRPRRNPAEQAGAEKPRKRLPSWDDVLFGSAPANPPAADAR
jgi:hypothetical protein